MDQKQNPLFARLSEVYAESGGCYTVYDNTFSVDETYTFRIVSRDDVRYMRALFGLLYLNCEKRTTDSMEGFIDPDYGPWYSYSLQLEKLDSQISFDDDFFRKQKNHLLSNYDLPSDATFETINADITKFHEETNGEFDVDYEEYDSFIDRYFDGH